MRTEWTPEQIAATEAECRRRAAENCANGHPAERLSIEELEGQS